MDKYCQHNPHQGVILKCESLKYEELQDGKVEEPLSIFIEQINDPQNFGAILRTCYYIGITNIYVDDYSKCPLSPAVSKTSSGALEMLRVFRIRDKIQFFERYK